MIQSITFFKSPDDILKSHDKNTKWTVKIHGMIGIY